MAVVVTANRMLAPDRDAAVSFGSGGVWLPLAAGVIVIHRGPDILFSELRGVGGGGWRLGVSVGIGSQEALTPAGR